MSAPAIGYHASQTQTSSAYISFHCSSQSQIPTQFCSLTQYVSDLTSELKHSRTGNKYKLMTDLVLHDIVVLVFLYLAFHGAEVHGRMDDAGIARSNGVCHWECEEPIDIFAEKVQKQFR